MEEILEQQFAEECMENGYLVMTGKADFQEELNKYFKIGEFYPISFNPDEEITDDIILNHIEHFVYYEEYEKCKELRDLLSNEARSTEV